MFEIDSMIATIRDRGNDEIVLDMKGVTYCEFTGIEELVNRLVEVSDGSPIKFVNCDESMRPALDQCDPKEQITRYFTDTE